MNRSASLFLALLVTGCGAGASDVVTNGAPPGASPLPAPAASAPLRVYALDCGRIEFGDFGFFTESGKPTGKPRTLSDACVVVRHPKGTLLWDTGLDEAIGTAGLKNAIGAEYVDHGVREQLAAIGVEPKDVTYVGFSHLHADHAGNANLFPSATWLVGKAELTWAAGSPTPLGIDPKVFSAYKTARVEMVESDRDLFGDGTVRILETPGHTPGHQSLLVQLPKAGAIVFSGDLAHSHENWDKHVVPSFNFNREQTLASMSKVDALLAQTHGRIIVQHDAADVATLPKAPAFLE